jgi:hypothetical protein
MTRKQIEQKKTYCVDKSEANRMRYLVPHPPGVYAKTALIRYEYTCKIRPTQQETLETINHVFGPDTVTEEEVEVRRFFQLIFSLYFRRSMLSRTCWSR